MKLKTYIFRWVTLVTLLPATVLGLLATYYVQNRYYQAAEDKIQDNLNNIAAEITRSMQADLKLIIKLPEAEAFQQFLPVLDYAVSSTRHPQYHQRLAIINRFLEQYQTVTSTFDTFRLLDIRGNTVLKVRSGKQSRTHYDGFDPYPIMDKEILDMEHIALLSQLPADSVSFIELPQTREELGSENNLVIPDAVMPLYYRQQRVGYLSANLNGDKIDLLLELAARIYAGRMIIIEVDEDNSLRNGQILYDDKDLLRFTHLKSTSERIQNLDNGLLWNAFQLQPFGYVANKEKQKHYYYIEYFPYLESLTSWIIASEIDDQSFTSPFKDIRLGIWLLAGTALFTSLFLAHFASRSISQPIMKLAENLKSYADGKQSSAISSPLDELQQSSDSFSYMAKTLEQEKQERLKIEDMLLRNAKLASLGQMAAGIGHEINNPLNNIRSLSKLIKRELAKILQNDRAVCDAGRRKELGCGNSLQLVIEDVQSLDEEVVRASEIVQGVLNFARQIPGKAFNQLDLVALLLSSKSLVKQQAKQKQVLLSDNLSEFSGCDENPDACLQISGDTGKLQQALVNLLLNAIQASPDNAQVELKLKLLQDHQQESVIVTIRDYGEGIDSSVMDQIFDPFFTTKPVGQGTGLGLSISLGIILNHGGTLNITNAEGGGALVLLTLPRAANII